MIGIPLSFQFLGIPPKGEQPILQLPQGQSLATFGGKLVTFPLRGDP